MYLKKMAKAMQNVEPEKTGKHAKAYATINLS